MPIANGNEAVEPRNANATAIGDQWPEVQYSRFFNYPSPPPTSIPHPFLCPVKSRYPKGTWISTSSNNAAVALTADHSRSTSVLTVTFRQKVLEEHYISKLHFAWPQLSCLSPYPPRGSRVVFVSYQDHVGQIQKFALRFLTIYEAERFTKFLKESLQDDSVTGLPCGNSRSELSSQSEFIPSDEDIYRPRQDWSPMTSIGTFPQQVAPSFNHEVIHNSLSQDMAVSQAVGGNDSAFPPSFSSLLMKCCPVTEQAQINTSDEVDLKTEITKYLADSSFQDMLSKVQKVISEIGDDLLL